MMKNLPRFFIKNTSMVILLIIGLILIGISSYKSLPKEDFPEIEFPYIIVSTVYPGVSPEDMEKLVTKEIEKKIKSINGIKKVSSTSAESVSSIFIEFETTIKINDALQKVRDKISLAKSVLPKDVKEPIVQEVSFVNIPFMVLALSGDYGLVKLKEVADKLKDELESVSGILEVNVIGGLEREIQVLVDLGRLEALNLSLDDYTHALMATNINLPGGTMDLGDVNYLIRIPGEYKTVAEIRDTVLFSKKGRNVHVKDVANVIDTYKKITSKARLNGHESININVIKRTGENVIELSDKCKAVIAKYEQQSFPSGTRLDITSDTSEEIERMVDEMENSILLGFILVTAVLFLFLGFRNSLMVAFAMPMSMLITFIFLRLMNIRLNFLVLFSLILLLGMLVDNAIVVVENIFRYMQEEGQRRKTAAIIGAGEIIGPITSSTLTTVFAFLPLAFWPGLVGKFMSYLPKAVVIGLLASLFVAAVMNPVMCSIFLRYKKKCRPGEDCDSSLAGRVNTKMERLKEWYVKVLDKALNMPKKVIVFVLVLFVLALITIGSLPKQFFPSTPPSEFHIDIKMPIGSTLKVTNEVVLKIEKFLAENKNVKRYVANIGNKGGSLLSSSSSSDEARINVKLVDEKQLTKEPAEIINEVRDYLETIPGIKPQIVQRQGGPPTGDPIAIKVVGNDIALLKELSLKIQSIMKNTNGIVDIKDNLIEGRPEIHIEIDKAKAAIYGLNTSSIAMTARTAFNGVEATKFRDGDDEYDVIVKLSDNYKRDINSLRRLSVLSFQGEHVPIEKIAEIKNASGWGAIKRENYERVALVTADTDGSMLPSVALTKITPEIKKINLPDGYKIEYAGEAEEMAKAFGFLGTALQIALILILIVLVSQFNSFVFPLIILFTVMLSLIGVALGLKITNSPFGMMSFVGIIALAGIVVNNGILLIDYIIELRNKGLAKREAILMAGKTRLRPVLLTAVTTILGLVPITAGINIDFKKLSIQLGSNSSAYWGPMGSSVIFGLTVATMLTLIIVPVLYLLVDDWAQKFHNRRSNQEKAEETAFFGDTKEYNTEAFLAE